MMARKHAEQVLQDDDGEILSLKSVSKYFGNVIALEDVTLGVKPGSVTCVLGDNGAGKSTLIKILSGVHRNDTGMYLLNGAPVEFNSPRDALAHGIATVHQDLAVAPLMTAWRNFFLGNELVKGKGIFSRLDVRESKAIVRTEMAHMGIDVRDPDQTVGTMSGGEQQALTIARAIYFGARVLILDEPTSALGVKQSGEVLKYIIRARERGVAIIFISHNPHHAYLVGDQFAILNRGRLAYNYAKSDITVDDLTNAMAGGRELDELTTEIQALTN